MKQVCLCLLALQGWMTGLSAATSQETGLLERGTNALYAGQLDVAAKAFEEAVNQGRASDLSGEHMLRIYVALARVHMDAGNFHQAEQVLTDARVDVNRIQDAQIRNVAEAELTGNWGALHLFLGRLTQSRSELSEALAKMPDTAEANKLVPTMLNNLAAAELQLGLYEPAAGHQKAAIGRWKSMLPSHDPALIRGYASLATAQFMAKDVAGAKASMDEAVASARVTFGDHSPMLAELLQSHAVILKSLGKKNDAKEAEKEARQIGVPKSNPLEVFSFNAKAAASDGKVRVVAR